MALDQFNTSPTDRWLSLGPMTDYGTAEDSAPGARQGKGWDWVLEHGDDVIGGIHSALCLANPRRPGCPGDPNRQPVVVNQGVPLWVIIGLLVLFLLILLFIFKPSK
ncbi:hypothetical protein [Flavilitoribacter nigricans]|uniref:Uncharacterized protein n=1 Tax=Flavilitoribacter nigricans (strain ATCC 23147 / DSM 23189 / NBRC 102662 / NCIMB 1420 / SS-2) TaxID=1122177 RepID=A0A2D0NCQ9_FLAN2|nr:hypothetical protein [Flavilitoribacter nigricans]PHN06160.1 hypothetical protein CRP01_11285 [Flavilitoribacter nigricans DSM 23189 = NBRC 102662]